MQGCVPAEPASVSPGKIIVAPPDVVLVEFASPKFNLKRAEARPASSGNCFRGQAKSGRGLRPIDYPRED
jgi:hypothetical protein